MNGSKVRVFLQIIVLLVVGSGITGIGFYLHPLTQAEQIATIHKAPRTTGIWLHWRGLHDNTTRVTIIRTRLNPFSGAPNPMNRIDLSDEKLNQLGWLDLSGQFGDCFTLVEWSGETQDDEDLVRRTNLGCDFWL